MTHPELDSAGFPTEATLELIAKWPTWAHEKVDAVLEFVAAAWHYPDFATRELKPAELRVLHAEDGDYYLRLATGGWSGNESLIDAMKKNFILYTTTWRLSTCGGLHIFQFSPAYHPLKEKKRAKQAL